MPPRAGDTLGSYEIVELIGKGGMGEVYRARDVKLDREVAIKVLPEEFAGDEERLKRFRREAKLLATLNHPNIASIYGLEWASETHYLVLELVPGQTLAERIARGAVPVEEALAIAAQIADAHAGCDGDRRHSWNGGLHVSRTSERQESRRANRHFCVRGLAL